MADILLDTQIHYVGVNPPSGDYNDMENKPAIDGVTLTSSTTKADLGLDTIYNYKGQKENYSDLPTSGNKIGDVWNIKNADEEHGIKAGDNVAWNEENTWDILSGQFVQKNADWNATEGVQQILNKPTKLSQFENDIYDLSKIEDFLYYVDLKPEQQDEKYVTDYLEEHYHNKDVDTNDIPNGACSSVRKGNFYGRNYDWYYNNSTSFIVHNQPSEGKYESIGMAQLVTVEEEDIAKKLKLVSYFMLDGINEHGLFVNNNVVPTGDYGKTTGTHSDLEGDYYCTIELPKIILDRFTNAADAVDWLVNTAKVYAPYNTSVQIEMHFMIGDATETYLVEFINNVCKATKYTDKAIMTNFYGEGTTYDEDGHINYASVTPYGTGLERYNKVANQYNSIDSLETMRECMNSIKYTNAYSTTESPTWITEFAYPYADKGSTEFPNLTAQDTLATYESSGILTKVRNDFATRTRENPNTWQTVHSSVYDLSKKYFTLRVQEETTEYNIAFPVKTGYVAGEGIDITNNVIRCTLTNDVWQEGDGEGSVVTKANASQGGQAIGNYSVAEGYGSDAKGNYSHAEGQITTTNGNCAHAEGSLTTAQGDCSHAEGNGTIAQNQSEHAEGNYNKSNKASNTFGNAGNTIHSIGIGTGTGSPKQDRKNAVEVMQNGDVYVKGLGGYDGTNYDDANTLQDTVNSIKTYKPFPNDFVTNDTFEAFVSSVINSPSATEGSAYLGGISGNWMPWGDGNAECKVEFMGDGLALLTVSSSDIAPYHWEYNTYSGDFKWKSNIIQITNLNDAYGYEGLIVQYVGETTENYINGYFYKSVDEVWTQVNVQPAPSGLPDQTGHAGHFLTTDGTDASWIALNQRYDADKQEITIG